MEIAHAANAGIYAGAAQKGRESGGLATNWFSQSPSLASLGRHNCYCYERLKLTKAICVDVPSWRDDAITNTDPCWGVVCGKLPCTREGNVVAKWECFEEKTCSCKMKSWLGYNMTGDRCMCRLQSAASLHGNCGAGMANQTICNLLKKTCFNPSRHSLFRVSLSKVLGFKSENTCFLYTLSVGSCSEVTKGLGVWVTGGKMTGKGRNK